MTSEEICLRVQSGELKLAWGILSSSCSRLDLDPCKINHNGMEIRRKLRKTKTEENKETEIEI